MKSTSSAARWGRGLYIGVLFAFCAAVACAPSDPAPPLQFGQTGGETVVRVNDEAPEARMIVLEVIPNPSKVLSQSDERTWRVVGNRDNAVDQVTLGRTPPGWEEQVAWRPPDRSASVTVHVELTDGRGFVLDGEYR